MAIYESGEDYLETIYTLSQKNDKVLAVDVARELGYSKPSVTRAMKILTEMGLVESGKNITLTEAGKAKAEAVFEKHKVITEFLMLNGVGRENAAKDACRIEHYISDETFGCIKAAVNRMKNAKELTEE